MSTDLASTALDLASTVFDLDRPWRLDERAAIRPEPFGAMLYHFGTRNLSFLKSTTLLSVLRNLVDYPTARAACVAVGVTETDLPSYARACDEDPLAGFAIQDRPPANDVVVTSMSSGPRGCDNQVVG